MADLYFPAISTFEAMPDELPAVGCFGHEIVGRDDDFQLRVAPSGVSVKGRYWREGNFFKAVVHVQAAGMAPKTISAQIDLRPIAAALKQWHRQQHGAEARISGWPGSFFKAVKNIAKSKLVKQVAKGVRSVVRSKITGGIIGAAAVVFPAVGVPAAAAYATANAALSAIDKANEAKKQAQAILASGSPAQKAALQSRLPAIQQTLRDASDVRNKLREVALRANRGDLAARKAARIFSHVMDHRRRVRSHGEGLPGKAPGMVVTEYGKVVPGSWLLSAAQQSGVPLLPESTDDSMSTALQSASSYFSGAGKRRR
ncbi:MAG TPA: hypothetical protein VHB79_06090 [Polyangiaceae bacterium]|nr:hypothetical protein [Polyangiaceae bacterium]